ncbi:WD40 repeat domain-containing protein [Tundrisphaera sp. TA3]|uniref:WD40 repeat domain-containing protein n=1 Tax=Tundrisphaera sp. TA3 TaxID=3435775 RepID=UPI003EBCD6A3
MGLALAVVLAAGGLHLWLKPRPRLMFAFANTANQTAFSPDGRALLSGGPGFESVPSTDWWAEPGDVSWRARLSLRDGRSGAPLLGDSLGGMRLEPEATPTPVELLDFSRDGGLIAAGGWDSVSVPGRTGILRIWDAATGVEGPTLDLPGHGGQVAFADGGRTLLMREMVGSDQERIHRWDARTWQPLPEILLSNLVHEAAIFAPDGSALAVADLAGVAITLYDLPSGLKRTVLADPDRSGPQLSYIALQFSPDGRTLAVIRADGAVQLWDVPSSTIRRTLRPDLGDLSLGWSIACGDRYLALGAFEEITPSWAQRLVRRFTPGGRPAASALPVAGRIRIVDGLTGREVATLEGFNTRSVRLAFSPDERTLATTEMDIDATGTRQGVWYATKVWDISAVR